MSCWVGEQTCPVARSESDRQTRDSRICAENCTRGRKDKSASTSVDQQFGSIFLNQSYQIINYIQARTITTCHSMPKRKATHKTDSRGRSGHGKSDKVSHTILLTLDNNKRYAHTATSQYRITMASLQPNEKKMPHCICESINEERRNRTQTEDKVIVIVEHDLNEYILCILDQDKVKNCKLNLEIQPGEQIAFRTIGKTPVLLSGVSSEPVG